MLVIIDLQYDEVKEILHFVEAHSSLHGLVIPQHAEGLVIETAASHPNYLVLMLTY